MVKDYYRTLSDFRKESNQLVFLSSSNVLKWKFAKLSGNSSTTIYSHIRPDIFDPYYYRNFNIKNGKLIIVQNVEDGSLERALEVAEKWNKDKVNSGYRTEIGKAASRVTYTVYSEDGKGQTKKQGQKEKVSVIEYPDGDYAALLFI